MRQRCGLRLGPRVVVVKRRRLLIWASVRIHLDEVEDQSMPRSTAPASTT